MLCIKKFVSFQNDDIYDIEIMVDAYDQEVQRVLGANTISYQLNGLNHTEAFVNEFGAIDYDTVKVTLEYWPTKSLLQLPVTKFGKAYFDERITDADDTSFDEWLKDKIGVFPDSPRDKARNYWKSNGTWRTPIIVIKSDDFPEVDLQIHYQLYEGHTRLAWLNILDKYKSVQIQEKHLVWLIKRK